MILIIFLLVVHPIVWMFGRLLIGFCFCGEYIIALACLNNDESHDNQGKALSLYVIIQMAGILAGQRLLVDAEPLGFLLFIVLSKLVSNSFRRYYYQSGQRPHSNERTQ